jgi:hypothetical protein
MELKFPSQQLDNINLKIRIESLRSYINIVKDGISQSKNLEKDRINNRSEKVKDEIDQHDLRTSEQIFDLEYVSYFEGNFECSQIENTATYSIIPSCYMLLETNMVAFANIAKNHFFLDLKYNDLSGGKTEKIKTYLKKLAGIDVSKIKSWSSLKELEFLRNCIVHNEGKVNNQLRDIENIKQLPKKYKNCLSINKPFHENEQYLIIKFSLCELFLNKLESFFDELIEAFGFNQIFYIGSEASQQVLKERMNAKRELDKSIEKAKEIYNKRMEIL